MAVIAASRTFPQKAPTWEQFLRREMHMSACDLKAAKKGIEAYSV